MERWPLPTPALRKAPSFIPYLHELNVKPRPQRFTSWKFRLLSSLEKFEEILAALNGAQIPFVVVKGIALALEVYPTPFSRPFSDLDLFVAPERFGHATVTLLALGYTLDNTAERGRTPKHFVFVRPSWPKIELHHRISRDFSDPPGLIEEMVASRQQLRLNDTALWTPAPSLHALFVALHARNHSFLNPPVWALDLLLLDRKHPGLFSQLPVLFEKHGLSSLLPLLLAIVKDLFPREKTISSPSRLPLTHKACQRLVSESLRRDSSTFLATVLIRSILQSSLSDSMLWLLSRI